MRRLTCLDGLRGLLALYVLLSHILPFAAIPAGLAGVAGLLSHGGAAVDMFFALSGVVILHSLRRFQGHPGGFLQARVSRIFPVYLLAFALALLLRPLDYGLARMPWIGPDSPTHMLVSAGWPETTGMEIGLHLVMAHGLFPDAMLPHAWVRFLGAAWSLSTEWQFYVLALLLSCWRVTERRMLGVFLLLAMAGMIWMTLGPVEWQFSRAFLPNKAQYFALGIASVLLLAPGAERRAAWRVYLSVLAMVSVISVAEGGIGKLAAPLLWTLCLGAELGVLAPLAAILRQRALLWLGAISYPLYIAHEPIQKALCVVLSALADGDAALFSAIWLPASVLLPLLAAWGLHHWVEVPAVNWGRALATRSVRLPA